MHTLAFFANFALGYRVVSMTGHAANTSTIVTFVEQGASETTANQAYLEMFRYIENKDRTFLFGAYRGEKSQLDWILGEKTQRYEKLYNVRFNQDLFSQRSGGMFSNVLPDYVLIYNTQNPQEDYHLFPCVNSSVKGQEEMEQLDYPDPNGAYIVYSLGEELWQTFLRRGEKTHNAPKILHRK